MNLDEDILLAQKIVDREIIPLDYIYSDISGIYRCTNEKMSKKEYIDNIKDKKRILSIIASGDQIINSILFGSSDIEGYDISRFPKYYLMLKIAAIKSLSKEDYLDFFVGDVHSKLFNEDLYSKIYDYLDINTKKFWDSLFDYFDSRELDESLLFRSDIANKNIMINNNPYLENINYEILKSKLDDINIKFYTGDIFKLVNNSMDKYDLVNLSNIINYIKVKNNSYSDYKEFINTIPLNDNGIIITYLMSYSKYWKKHNLLNQFNEGFNSILIDKEEDNGLLIYKKMKRM